MRLRPSRKLRHLLQARTQTCTAPGCNGQAAHFDHDHSIPWPDSPGASAAWLRFAGTTTGSNNWKAGVDLGPQGLAVRLGEFRLQPAAVLDLGDVPAGGLELAAPVSDADARDHAIE